MRQPESPIRGSESARESVGGARGDQDGRAAAGQTPPSFPCPFGLGPGHRDLPANRELSELESVSVSDNRPLPRPIRGAGLTPSWRSHSPAPTPHQARSHLHTIPKPGRQRQQGRWHPTQLPLPTSVRPNRQSNLRPAYVHGWAWSPTASDADVARPMLGRVETVDRLAARLLAPPQGVAKFAAQLRLMGLQAPAHGLAGNRVARNRSARHKPARVRPVHRWSLSCSKPPHCAGRNHSSLPLRRLLSLGGLRSRKGQRRRGGLDFPRQETRRPCWAINQNEHPSRS